MAVTYSATLKTNRMQLVADLIASKTAAASTGTALAGTLVIGDTNLSGGTSFTVTFTNGSANIGGTGLPTTVGTPVVFSTSGTLPTNFTPGTTYYVLTGSTSTVMLVGATPGGASITAGSAGTGTHTAVFGVIASFTLSTTPFVVAGAVATLQSTPLSATASATATASKAELRNNAGTVIVSGLTVGTSGTDITISSTSITSGQTVQVTSGTITHG